MVIEMDKRNATKDSAVRALLRHHGMRCLRRMGLHYNNELWVSTTAISPATGRPYDCETTPKGKSQEWKEKRFPCGT